MAKNAFKDVKKKVMKTLSGRKSVEVNQFDITDPSVLDGLRGKHCYKGFNALTKPMMKFMSADELANKPVLSADQKNKKKEAKKSKTQEERAKKTKNQRKI